MNFAGGGIRSSFLAGNLDDAVGIRRCSLFSPRFFPRLRLVDLHSQAALAKSHDAVKVYTSAAARLLGEIRRVALALREYRGKPSKKEKADSAE